MKRFFFCNVIIALAVLVSSNLVNAAQVTQVLKKRSAVRIDEGTSSGMARGNTICFFNQSGKKIACGKIRRANANSAIVGISKTRIQRIRKGFEATVSGGKKTKGSSGKQIVTLDIGLDHRTNIKGGYIFSVLTPSKYNKLTYNAPKDQTEKVDSLWTQESTSSNSPIGFFAEGEFGIGERMALSIGLRYRYFRDFVPISDYNKEVTQRSRFAEVEQKASALGLYSDFTFLDIPFSPSFFFRMSSGLDIDQSSVEINASQKNDEGTENVNIASYKSSLTVLSLRLGMNLNFLIAGPLGVSFGINGLIPAAAFGKSASADVKDPQADSNFSGGSKGASKDLIDAVGHDKSSFGAEIFFATYFAF